VADLADWTAEYNLFAILPLAIARLPAVEHRQYNKNKWTGVESTNVAFPPRRTQSVMLMSVEEKMASSARSGRSSMAARRPLLSAQAGESRFVVDGDGCSIAAATSSTASTELATVAATSSASAELTTISSSASEVSTLSTLSAIAAVATEVTAFGAVSSSSAAAAATTTPAGVASLLFEAVVNVEELFLASTLALALGLLFALEVILVVALGELLGSGPFLVLLRTLVGFTGFFETKSFHLLGGLLGKVVSVGFVTVLRFSLGFTRAIDNRALFGNGDLFSVLVPGWVLRIGVKSSFFDFFGRNGFTGFFVRPFTLASALAPAMVGLLLMITVAVSMDGGRTRRRELTLLRCGCDGLRRDEVLRDHVREVVHLHRLHCRLAGHDCSFGL
jgi:hypothetical protein